MLKKFYTLSELSVDFRMWGTGLRPYLAQLQESDHPIFEQELLERIKQTYPVQKNGTILFRFPRLFWIARKGR